MSAITITDLSKTFTRKNAGKLRSHKALDTVSLAVSKTEMLALIGASGSGKSTLLRHISGLLTADAGVIQKSGVVTVNEHAVQTGGRLSRNVRDVRADIAVIFQQFNLVNRLTLLENVLLGNLGRINFWRGALGHFSKNEKLRAMEALDRVGMADFALQRASTLSGGQQQRGAIARALVQEASIILADEPIASLDPESARLVMDSLKSINTEDGTTVVVSLHQVAYAKKYCPRTVALRKGNIVFDGQSSNLDNATLCDLYGSQCQELLMDETMGSAPVAQEPPPEKIQNLCCTINAVGA